MPCYAINLVSVDIRVADKELLFKALESAGFTYWRSHTKGNVIDDMHFRIHLNTGKVEVPESSKQGIADVNKLKRHYSRLKVEKVVKAKMAKMKRINANTYKISI